MSIDKYYNNHSIKILNDNNLTIEAQDAAVSCEGKIHIRADGEEGLRLTGAGSSILIDDQTESYRMITYTSQVHKFTGTYTNDTAFFFEYSDNDEDTEDVFEIKMSGRSPDFVVNNNGAITFHRSVYFKNGDPQDGKVLTASGTSGLTQWKHIWEAFDFDEQYLQNPTFYVESGSYTVDTTPAGVDSGFVEFVAPSSIKFTVQQGEHGSHSLWLQDDNQVKVTGPTGAQRQGILLVENQSSSGEQIGIEIEISSNATNGDAAWIQFQDHNNNVRGCIKTSPDYDDGMGHPFMYIKDGGQRTIMNDISVQYIPGLVDTDSDPDQTNWVTDSIVHRVERVDSEVEAGMAMFLSGGADFGEFFHVGDASEWPDEWGALKIKKDLKENAKFLNIPEGLLVWVRENRFYRYRKDNSCIPMLVTKRAVVVGDAKPLMAKSSEGFVGEILSFCGKLPAIVRGDVRSGDYLVPVSDEGFCRAVPCNAVTFEEYRQSVGRALSSSSQGDDDTLHLVLCAVGVK